MSSTDPDSTLLLYLTQGGSQQPQPTQAPKTPPRFADLEPRDQIAAYAGFRVFEGDYDKAQGTLRVVASTWIIATVGALGLLILAHYPSQTGPQTDAAVLSLLRQFVLFASTLGLSALWYLDQRVYQRLLHSVFALACRAELECKALPPIRSYAFLLVDDVTSSLGVFYKAPVVAFAICAAVNAAIAWFLSNGIAATYSVCVAGDITCITKEPFVTYLFGILHVVVGLGLLWTTRKWRDLSDELPQQLRQRTIDKAELLDRLTASSPP